MITDLPNLDKPREKAIHSGIESLSDTELLAILIRTGTKSYSALDLAHIIQKQLGSIYGNTLSMERLMQIKGLGQTKAITILSALELGKRVLKNETLNQKINNAKDIYNYFKYYFYNKKQEQLMVAFLDNNKRIISYKKLYIGTINIININQKDIFKEAFLHSSSNIILIHNHPNNCIYPSKEDLNTTRKIKELGHLLDINLIDHIIITNNNYYSFLENGDIK